MLVGLSIRDVVLIDRLDLRFEPGLCVLTGETGAGKSILLDALGLALGGRAEQALLRAGAEQAVVSALFSLPAGHPAAEILTEQGMAGEAGELVLRRQLGRDGRTRAFVNDQPVTVSLLRQLGDALVEIQGQFEQRGLLEESSHRGLLDSFGGLEDTARTLDALWRKWRASIVELEKTEEAMAAARREESFLSHAVDELNAFAPERGEETSLAEQRTLLINSGKILESMTEALELLSGEAGRSAEAAIAGAQRLLERVGTMAGARLEGAVEALERASAECETAVESLQALLADSDLDPARRQEIEDRYFALKELARKYRVEADDLPELQQEYAERLSQIESGDAHIKDLKDRVAAARTAYMKLAETLSKQRVAAAKALDRSVNAELPPLKLEKAQFATRIERLAEENAGPAGLDRVIFEICTNPGQPPGPLARIASGGELSRFLLALKVVLAKADPGRALVFDEVDSGIGGATADAVGERLARLAEEHQVLVVTHSPQVAARGQQHLQVAKVGKEGDKTVVTQVAELDSAARREEIARMLAGATVTEEARAAAARLLAVR